MGQAITPLQNNSVFRIFSLFLIALIILCCIATLYTDTPHWVWLDAFEMSIKNFGNWMWK